MRGDVAGGSGPPRGSDCGLGKLARRPARRGRCNRRRRRRTARAPASARGRARRGSRPHVGRCKIGRNAHVDLVVMVAVSVVFVVVKHVIGVQRAQAEEWSLKWARLEVGQEW